MPTGDSADALREVWMEGYNKGLSESGRKSAGRADKAQDEVARLACENAALRKRVEELERERDDYRSKAIDRQLRLEESSNACAQLQADLDAALKWIEGYTDGPSGWGPTSQRVKALLEKRRDGK